jgi:hypothetical protein
MTANQRRPGFRLPWSSEEDAEAESAVVDAASQTPTGNDRPAAADAPAADAPAAQHPASQVERASAAPAAAPAGEVPPVTPSVGQGPDSSASPDFMRELVTAMRGVADEARQAGITEARSRAEEQVKRLEAEAERRREEIRSRTDADVAAVGEWARAEADRITAEAEQRVAARRAQLEQQLAAETDRAGSEARALRERVSAYEQELDAYHAQLAEITDPAAFAAAAKRMPQPPTPDTHAAAPARPAAAGTATVAAPTRDVAGDTNGATPGPVEVHPTEEVVLTTRLAELDSELPDTPAAPAPTAAEATVTEILVRGLGSFGAITGFRQALSGVPGIDSVALSLGQAGEFVFRATHQPGFDVSAAIVGLEGDGAKVEPRPEGGLEVKLDRAR